MAEFRLIVSGSRDWGPAEQIYAELDTFKATHGYGLIVKVGDCPTGVDRLVRAWCKSRGVGCVVFEADWSAGEKAGPIRNGNMVRSGGDYCLGFNWGARPFKKTGTHDCCCQAANAGIPVRIIPKTATPAPGREG